MRVKEILLVFFSPAKAWRLGPLMPPQHLVAQAKGLQLEELCRVLMLLLVLLYIAPPHAWTAPCMTMCEGNLAW